MPKIRQDIEENEEAEEEDESQFMEDEETEDLDVETPQPIKKQIPAGLRAYQENRRKLAQQRQIPQQAQNMQPQAPKRRYGIVPAQPVRIVDVEGQEVLAEGEYLIAQALADIIERLERIENTIGSMIQG